MSVDINNVVKELNETLRNVYEIEKKFYDLYLSNIAKDVEIDYYIDGQKEIKKVPNFSKLKSLLEVKFSNLMNVVSVLNLFPDPGFIQGHGLEVISGDAEISIANLSVDDKIDISTLFDENIFKYINQDIKKLVINNNTNSESKIALHYRNTRISIYHKNGIRYNAIAKVNDGKWQLNGLNNYKPQELDDNYVFEIIVPAHTKLEIVLPYIYGTFNHGIPMTVVLDLVYKEANDNPPV